MEKMKNEYEGDCTKLVDIARCSVVVQTEDQLVGVAHALDDKALVVRCKNRFKHPLWNGYRDALFNIEVNGHICEVQLHLGAILAHTEETHRYYAYFRTFFAGNLEATRERMDLLDKIVNPPRASTGNSLAVPSRAGSTSWQASASGSGSSVQIERSLNMILESDDQGTILNVCELAETVGDWNLKLKGYHRLTQLDPGNLDYAFCLGHSFRQNDDYPNASPVLELCLQKAKYDLGVTDPKTLRIQNVLASLRYHQGHYKAAAALYTDCLKKRRKALGDAHPDTLRSMNNLALLLVAQSKYKQALPLYVECLEGRTEVLGEGHPDTVGTLMNLGALEAEAGHTDKALEILRECLSKNELVLGKLHPYTRTCHALLSKVLEQQSSARSTQTKAQISKRVKVVGALQKSSVKRHNGRWRSMKARASVATAAIGHLGGGQKKNPRSRGNRRVAPVPPSAGSSAHTTIAVAVRVSMAEGAAAGTLGATDARGVRARSRAAGTLVEGAQA